MNHYSSDFRETRLKPYRKSIGRLEDDLKYHFYMDILPVIVKIGLDSYFTEAKPEARVSFSAESITQEEKDAL